jgi:hypothetical protein
MTRALKSRLNMLEGDVRLDRQGLAVMAHGFRQDDGMALDAWLEVADRSGRAIKLDFKDHHAVGQALDALECLGVADERVMLDVTCVNWQLLDQAPAQQVLAMHRRMPEALIALSCGRIPYSDASLARLRSVASVVGDHKLVTFPLESRLIDERVVSYLHEAGTISAWNEPLLDDPRDLDAERTRLRKVGVDGMIDLRHEGQEHGQELAPQLTPLRDDPAPVIATESGLNQGLAR